MTRTETFTADITRINKTLNDMGAVRSIIEDDGNVFTYVDTAVAPAGLVSAYQGLVQYGYANGLI